MNINLTILKKDEVLKNEIDIWSLYLGVPVSVILECLETNKKICNPTRDDRDPSLGFKYINNKIYAKDFAGYFQGDIFDLIGGITNLNPKNSQDFIKILLEIKHNKDLKNVDYVRPKIKEYLSGGKAIYEFRNWNSWDVEYFKQFKVLSTDIVEAEFMYPLQYFEYGKVFYSYRPTDPAYIYLKGLNKNDIMNFQVYFPKRKKKGNKPRFITNSNTLLFGLQKYTPNKNLLITKSGKDLIIDRVLIKKFTNDITTLAIPAESIILKDNILNILKNDFDNLFTLFDNDRVGKYLSNQYRKLGFTPLFIEDAYKSKDSGEFVCNNSLTDIYTATETIIKKYIK